MYEAIREELAALEWDDQVSTLAEACSLLLVCLLSYRHLDCLTNDDRAQVASLDLQVDLDFLMMVQSSPFDLVYRPVDPADRHQTRSKVVVDSVAEALLVQRQVELVTWQSRTDSSFESYPVERDLG